MDDDCLVKVLEATTLTSTGRKRNRERINQLQAANSSSEVRLELSTDVVIPAEPLRTRPGETSEQQLEISG